MTNQFLGTASDSTLFGAQPPSYYLNYNNLSNKPSLAFLPLSGGTLTGLLQMQKGSYTQSFNGGSGTAGYIRIAAISIIGYHQNAPIYFKIQQRGKIGSNLYLAFKNIANTNPDIDYFIKTSSSLDAYIHRPSEGLYHLYIGKSEGYDNIAVTSYHLPPYMSSVNLAWDGTFVTSVPSGGTSAVFRNTADSLLNARTISLTGNVTGSTSFDGSKNVAIATQLAWSITLGTGDNAEINQNGSVYRQKFQMFDNATPNDLVFVFSQSENSGASYKTLMQINDDGNVIANRFTGNATSATQLATSRNIFGQPFNGTANVSGKGSFYGKYTSTPSDRYANSALEIRECDLVLNNQTDVGYAPRIGFHWGHSSAATLAYMPGQFQFRNQSDTGYSEVRASTFIGNLSGTASYAATSEYTGMVNGLYTGSGGNQPPSYIPKGKVRFNMMRGLTGYGDTVFSGYCDCMLMDTYSGSDVPIATGFGIARVSGNPRAWIFNGNQGGTKWNACTELITGSNISAQSVSYSTNSGQLGGVAAANYINTSDTLILRGVV